MQTHYVLVDYENVPVKSLSLLRGQQFRVCVFLGKNNTRLDTDLVVAMQALGERAQYVKLTTTGPNALDFHIAFHLGELMTRDAAAHFHVISKDKGFDSLIEHLQGKNLKATRADSIEKMACFPQPAAPACVSPPPVAKKLPEAPPTPTPKPATQTSGRNQLDARMKVALTDLQSRKTGRPAKQKTLVNTIHAKIGKELPVAAAQAVFDALVAKKYVSVNGLKVAYHLPKGKAAA